MNSPRPKEEAWRRSGLPAVGEVKSRGRTYRQLWLPRELGEQVEKGASYEVELRKDGSLVLRPAEPEEASE